MIALRNTAVALTLALFTLLPTTAQAATFRGQPIYAQNNTNCPIWVAANYIPPGSSSFVTNGWWRVDPGQRTLILYNNGRYIYFSAHDAHGKTWNGNDSCVNVRGERVDMFQSDTGPCYEPWTQSFNP